MKPSLFDELLVNVQRDLDGLSNPTPLSTMAIHDDCDFGEDLLSPNLVSARSMAIDALLPGLRKRYIGPTMDQTALTAEDREQLAVVEFLDDNQRCSEFNNSYSPLHFDGFIASVRGEVKNLLASALEDCGILTMSDVASRLRCGPGASSDVATDPSEYSRFFGGSISFSSLELKRLYTACTNQHHLTRIAEAIRLGYGVLDPTSSVAQFLSVPKTNLKNRGICKQPSGNMMFQLATHDILCDVLKSVFHTDLEVQQDLNRDLAQRGSRGRKSLVNASWEFVTGDLSRASNFPLITMQDLLSLCPSWLTWLMFVRSPFMAMPDGTRVPKHMCSTMGNGFTFSLMTVLLSAIVVTVYKFADLPLFDVDPINGRRIKTWAVYGDDIIVDKSVWHGLVRVLTAFGFLVNHKKSCTEGLFRESCGGDFYDGVPVRPVFCETLQTHADVYSLMNRLSVWGASHSVPLPFTLRGLLRVVSSKGSEPFIVPNWEDVTAGIHAPYHCSKPCTAHWLSDDWPAFKRAQSFIENYQGGTVYRCLSPRRKSISLFVEKQQKVKYSCVLTRTPEYYINILGVEFIPDVNHAGVLLCTIAGSVRSGEYGIRDPRVQYDVEYKIAPQWGDPTLSSGLHSQSRETRSNTHRLWEEYVAVNIFNKKPKLIMSLKYEAFPFRFGYENPSDSTVV
jgi:hypothetical protein